MTLPNPMNPNDLIGGVAIPQPVAAVASRLGVLDWFGSASSINTGTGSIGEPPNVDECSTQHEEITVDPGNSIVIFVLYILSGSVEPRTLEAGLQYDPRNLAFTMKRTII